MNSLAKAAALVMLGMIGGCANLLGQGHSGAVPPVAATAPLIEVGGGYSYVSLEMPGESRVGLNGGDGSIVANIGERWGAMFDASYARMGNVLSTGHGGSVLTFMGGPVFYPVNHGNLRVFFHGLVGLGRVDSAVVTGPETVLAGEVSRIAYAVGGGVEYDLSRRFALRVGPDYLHTTFADVSGKDQGQNNLRMVVSLAFKFN